MSNERIEIEPCRASPMFEALIRKHWGKHYEAKGEVIAQVWITHMSVDGGVTGYDVLTATPETLTEADVEPF